MLVQASPKKTKKNSYFVFSNCFLKIDEIIGFMINGIVCLADTAPLITPGTIISSREEREALIIALATVSGLMDKEDFGIFWND